MIQFADGQIIQEAAKSALVTPGPITEIFEPAKSALVTPGPITEIFDEPAKVFSESAPATESAASATYSFNADNGGPDPIQGFDCEVFVQRRDLMVGGVDAANQGGYILLGQFTGLKLFIRSGTEPYMEYDSRSAINFDGEMEFFWTLEKGLVSMDVFEEVFGASVLGTKVMYSLLPRLQITFNVNTLSQDSKGEYTTELNGIVDYGRMPATRKDSEDQEVQSGIALRMHRKPNGRIVLKDCKVNNLLFDISAGRKVAAVSLNGIAQELVSLSGPPKSLGGNGALETFPVRRADTSPMPINYAKKRLEFLGSFAKSAINTVVSGIFR